MTHGDWNALLVGMFFESTPPHVLVETALRQISLLGSVEYQSRFHSLARPLGFVLCGGTFSRYASLLLFCAPITMISLVSTLLPSHHYGVMRGAFLVEISSPGDDTRVPLYLAGDAVSC